MGSIRITEAELDRREQYMYELGRAAGYKNVAANTQQEAADAFVNGRDKEAELLRNLARLARTAGEGIEKDAREKNKAAEDKAAARSKR